MSNLLEYLKQVINRPMVRLDLMNLDGSAVLDAYGLSPEDVAAIKSKEPVRLAAVLRKLGAVEKMELYGLLGLSHDNPIESAASSLAACLSGVGQVVIEKSSADQVANLMEQLRKQGDLGD